MNKCDKTKQLKKKKANRKRKESIRENKKGNKEK